MYVSKSIHNNFGRVLVSFILNSSKFTRFLCKINA